MSLAGLDLSWLSKEPDKMLSSILLSVRQAQALPIFDACRRPILMIEIGAFDALIEMLEIGVHEQSPFAAGAVGELHQGGSEAPHHLDRIFAVLADFIEREREVIAPAWHLEDYQQLSVLVEGTGRLEVAFCEPHQQILYLIDGLNSGRRIIDSRRKRLDGDIDQ